MYVPTNSEIIVSNLLLDKGINSVFKLNIYDLANAFNIHVKNANINSIMHDQDACIIFLDERKSERLQYISFLHELSHYIRNDVSVAVQKKWQYNYCELKTNYLVQYIAMPFFLIDKIIIDLKSVEAVANYFRVTHELARKRLEGIRNRITTRSEMYYASIQRQENRKMVFSD